MNHRFENALVLSGGSIKGAFQAGAIAIALQKGFVPHAIYGISVGALNGAFLADRAGRAVMKGQIPDWPAIGRELVDFWKREIKSCDNIAKKRGLIGMAAALIFKNWDGLTDTTPIRKLLQREVKLEHLQNSPVYFTCGATNLNTGQNFYADAHNAGSHFLDFIIASTAVPFFMPQVVIRRSAGSQVRESAYVDGALRDSSPLGIAIHKGATHVMGIYCHPENLDIKLDLDHRKVMTYTERVMDIISNEHIVNDHKLGVMINELIRAGAGNQPGSPLAGKRVIRGLKRVIRPEKEIPFKQDEITPEVISTMIEWGKRSAEGYFTDIVHDVEEDPRGNSMHVA